MWRAPEEVRLRRAADWLVDRIPELWKSEAHRSEYGHYSLPLHRHTVTTLPQPQRNYYDETIAALAGAFGEAELQELIPQLYFYPRQGLLPEPPAGATPGWWTTRQQFAGSPTPIPARRTSRPLLSPNSVTLVEAVAGWNRSRIEKSLDRLVQVSLKAYGLLPLQDGEPEVLDRYRRLRRAARECRKFGAEREANTRSATLVGLANLAQTAGHESLEQLEWAVEARIQESAAQSLRIAEYDVALEFAELTPRITVRRAGRELKAPPAAVRSAEAYKELRASADEIKAQASRFRRALEEAMLEGRPFAPADLTAAHRLASLSTLLARVVLVHPDGTSGLLAEDGLIDLEGRRLPHRDGTRIGHPLDVSGAELRAWQQHLVERGFRQPFKQVFREVYLATDAERGADETRRFAGHELEGSVLRRLLGNRGWRVAPGDVPEPFRPFKAAGLRAWFDFPTARHYIGEDSEPLISGAIWFTRDVGFGPRIRLGEVPERILSEVYRDADLMVAAAREGEDMHSDEAYARRAETVQALAAMLGVPGVERDGRYVVVSGKLARYRVHLGSATVQIEPAKVVCILPARQAPAKDALWLPFAEEDERLAEVVSKVLLLASDDRLADPALLAQIRAAAGAH